VGTPIVAGLADEVAEDGGGGMIWLVVAVLLIVAGVILLVFDRSHHTMPHADDEGEPDLFEPPH
jgi:hypothetical protein